MTTDLITRRTLLHTAAAGAAFSAAPAFAQSNWPERNVRMIVPYPAGGSTDVLLHPGGKAQGQARPAVHGRGRRARRATSGSTQVVKGASRTATRSAARQIGHFAINQYFDRQHALQRRKGSGRAVADLRTAPTSRAQTGRTMRGRGVRPGDPGAEADREQGQCRDQVSLRHGADEDAAKSPTWTTSSGRTRASPRRMRGATGRGDAP